MRTKDFRLSKKASKFKRRIELYASVNWMGEKSREDFRQNVKKGIYCNWLRTTSRPCNCYMCSGSNKYKSYDNKKRRVSSVGRMQDS